MAWLIRNRFEDGAFGDNLNEVLKDFPSSSPSSEAKKAVKEVFAGKIESPIDERCYYVSKDSDADPRVADPIQIPEGKGNKYLFGTDLMMETPDENAYE